MGMVSGLLGGVALSATNWLPDLAPLLFVLAALAMQLRLQANLLDGMVAIQTGKASRLGELFNEVPDRISDTALLVGAGYASGEPVLGLWAALAAMLTAYIRTTGKTAGAPMDFCGPMAKQHRMAVLTLASVFAATGWDAGLASASGPPSMRVALWVILTGSLLTAARRLVRAARFLQAETLRDSTETRLV